MPIMTDLVKFIPPPIKTALRPLWHATRRLSKALRPAPPVPEWIEDLKRLSDGTNYHTVFDVGASRGLTSLLFARAFPNAHVRAFEPIPEIAESARLLHKHNPKITVECLALHAQSGTQTFHVNAFSETSSLLASAATGEGRSYLETCRQIDVAALSLDEYCASNCTTPIDLLKLDVQGCELEVLRGATKTLVHVGAIFAEVLFARYYCGQCGYSELDDFLRGHGFWLYRFYDFDYADDGRLLQTNGMWLNKSRFPQDGRPLDEWERKLIGARPSAEGPPAQQAP